MNYDANKFLRRAADERGAILIIVAAVAMGVIAIIFVLGINSVRVQRATQELRFVNDEICASVAENPLVQASAAQNFAAQINTMVQTGRVPYIQNVNARITIPTMPVTLTSPLSPTPVMPQCNCSGPSCIDTVSDAPFLSSQNPPISEVSISACSSSGTSCSFEGDICNTYESNQLSSRYPVNFISNSTGAGSTVACEVTATVASVVPAFGIGNQTIVSRVVWERQLRNTLGPPSTPASLPGLTIAISTYLQIPNSLALNAPTFSFGNGIYPNIQPLIDPVQAQLNASIPNFSWQRPIGDNSNNRKQQYPWNTGATFSIPPFPLLSSPDNTDLLTACMNPAVLVRNLFVSTIVELASRHGELRNRTEILHPNPRGGPGLNPPTQIVRFGQDLTAMDPSTGKGYQIPYLYYQLTAPFTAGALQVLPSINPPSDQTRALLASQLRVCYSLYQGASTTAQLLDRFGTANPNNSQLGIAINQLLSNTLDSTPIEDDANISSPYARPPSLYQVGSAPIGGPNQPWDQKCPWGTNSSLCTSLPASDFSRPLRAAEVVSILGSSQACPFKTVGTSYPGYPSADCLNSMPAWNSDLAPDWLATLGYIRGTSNALASPGMFAVVGTVGANGQTPFGPDGGTGSAANVYKQAQSVSTSVLLVLHRPPDGPGEAQAILNLITAAGLQGGPGNRTITVAYFPTNTTDSSATALAQIQQAFNIPTTTDDDATQNALFVFSPNSQKYDGMTNPTSGLPVFSCLASDPTEQCFISYWQYMLGESTNTQENIVDAAANIFLARFFRKQRRL